jgi:dTDP-glucose 4,6-dehydratase
VGVFHLAAETHVDRSIVSADDFVQTNVVGTYSMLEAARPYWNGLRDDLKRSFRFLHVSTDEVFGALGEEGYFSEETPYAPNSPYSASKAASDHFARAYHHTYGLPTLITNCSNNYGPYQFPEKMIPVILNALSTGLAGLRGANVRIGFMLTMQNGRQSSKGNPGETCGGCKERRNIDLVNQIAASRWFYRPNAARRGLKSYPTDPLCRRSPRPRSSLRDRFGQDHASVGLAGRGGVRSGAASYD